MACAFLAHLVETTWLQTMPSVVKAATPLQTDNWRCGDGVGLIAEFVISELGQCASLAWQ